MFSAYNKDASSIAEIASALAAQQRGATASASRIIECICAAASPMVVALFSESAPPQDRLLFALILTGACSTLSKPDDEHYGITINICPETINEAMQIYTQITGNDIRQHLPPSMLKFADSQQRTIN